MDKPRASLRLAVSLVFFFSIGFFSVFLLSGDRLPPSPPSLLHPAHTNDAVSPTNISHIVFGIGGCTNTWARRRQYVNLWWTPQSTRGYVFFEKHYTDSDTKSSSKISYRVSSNWTRFPYTTGSDSAVRLARIVVDLFALKLENVRWFVMGDDDTVFFPDNLAAVLGKYDHRRMMYVGGNSESVEQNVMHAYSMAFGGGGFAVSYALAEKLSEEMDGCLERYHYFYGSDQRVWACVTELGVRLTTESGFHQMDIRGDPFGLLAAHPLAPLVSLHHVDHMGSLVPKQTKLGSLRILLKAYEADPLRTLQHCFCFSRNEWSVSVSWGYAIQIYSYLMAPFDLERPLQTFQTWRTWKDEPFTFNTRPMNPDPCKQPIIFYLHSVQTKSISSATVTKYKKIPVDTEAVKRCNESYARAFSVEKVVVIAPVMDPHEWDQRPRRQCCEVINSRQSTMRIRITGWNK